MKEWAWADPDDERPSIQKRKAETIVVDEEDEEGRIEKMISKWEQREAIKNYPINSRGEEHIEGVERILFWGIIFYIFGKRYKHGYYGLRVKKGRDFIWWRWLDMSSG